MIWGWGAPWFFVFLGSLIPLLFIYLFRRKARPFFTAALFLWGSAGEEGGAAPRFRLMKLPVNFFLHAGALLLLVCAGAALFTFRQDRFPPAAVILNNSYAMTPEVRKKAAEMLRHHLSRFHGRRVVYFRAGTLPERLDLRGAAADLSSFWKADEPEFRAGRAIAAAGMHVPGGEIIVVTDRPLPEKPPHVTCLCAGTPGPNAAIVNARYSDGRILLEVENFSLIPLEPELTAGNFARRRFTLGPKERKVFRLTVPVLAGPCRVLLKTPGDKLPFDDAALLLPEPREPVRFACRSLPPAADRAVKQVLEGNPEFRRDDSSFEVLFTAAASGAGSQVIFHQGKTVAADGHEPALNSDSPLTEGLSAASLTWGRFRDLPLPGRGVIFSSREVLLSEESAAQGSCRIHFNISFPHSNVTARPFWPGLFCNLAARFRALRPGPEHTMYQAGELIRFRTRGREEKITCRGPGVSGELTGAEGQLLFRPTAPGLYTFAGPSGRHQAAVNPKVTAISDLRSCRTEVFPCDPGMLGKGGHRRVWSVFFIAGALLLLLLEQFIGTRRKS